MRASSQREQQQPCSKHAVERETASRTSSLSALQTGEVLPQQHSGCMRTQCLCLVMPSTGGPHSMPLCVCARVGVCVCACACVHSVRTLSHDASSRRMTQTVEQLLKALFFLSMSPTDSHQNESPAPQLHLIYPDPPSLPPQKKTWLALLTLEYLHMDRTQMW